MGSSFLQGLGLGSQVQDSIHPRDEMYTFMRNHPDFRPRSHRFRYYRGGYEALLSLQNLLQACGRSLTDTRAMLEFACGHGRFTRFLVQQLDPVRVWSSDIVPEAVDYVQRLFGVSGIVSTADPAEIDLGRRYDLIFVASLFSHLPERRFGPWLSRLFDALSDEGLLVFSTHGAEVVPGIAKHSSGFTFVDSSESRVLRTAEYGSTFVTPQALRSIAGSVGIDHLVTLERDLWSFQDLHVAARRETPGLESWGPTSLVLGQIDRLRIDADKRFSIGGWAVDRSSPGPLAEVRLMVDGEEAGRALLGQERADVTEVLGMQGPTQVGWYLEGLAADLTPGEHILAVRGRSSAGHEMCFDMLPFNADRLPLDLT